MLLSKHLISYLANTSLTNLEVLVLGTTDEFGADLNWILPMNKKEMQHHTKNGASNTELFLKLAQLIQ